MVPQILIRNYLAIVAVLVCVSIAVCSDMPEETVLEPEELYQFPASKRSSDDLTKILLKKMRFRDTEPMLNTLRQYHAMPKAKRQEMLMNNLAALLSDLKQRHSEPTLRIPSLRFG